MALVKYEFADNGVGTITLNDPDQLNAMGEEMAKEFKALTNELYDKHRDLRVLILTGEGRAFSAGGDLEMLEKKSELSGEENRLRMINFYNSFLGILRIEVPIIAAINGHAIGAGLCVASACDIRVVAEGAKLGFTFARLGLHPGMGATYFLPQVVGHSVATELMLTGRVITSEEALEIGLVSRVVEKGKAVEAANEIAAEIMTCGPEAIRQLVGSMRSETKTLQQALAREASCQAVNYSSGEFKEGVRATIEKRKPTYSV